MFHRCAAIVLLFVVTAAPKIQAAENPAEWLSSEVSFIVRLKNPQATTEKIAGFGEKIQEGFGFQVRASAQGMGMGIFNPTLAGVDRQADWWMGVYAEAEDKPAIVFIIPAKDLDAMRDEVTATREGMTFIAHEKWGIYSDNEEAANIARDRIAGKGQSAASLIDEELQTVFDAGDLSLFINSVQLMKVYEGDLLEAKASIEANLENGPPQVASMAALYMIGVEGLYAAAGDTRGAVATVVVDKVGATLDILARVEEGTPTSKNLDFPLSENPLLARLPSGGLAYFAISTISSNWQRWGLQAMKSMSQLVEQDEESFERYKKVVAKFEKIKYGAIAASFSLQAEGADPGIRTVSLSEVDQPKKLRELMKEFHSALSELEFGGVTTRYELTEEAESFGKHKADTVKVEQDLGENNVIPLQGFYEMMFGEEGMLTRLIYTDKQLVQTMGGGKRGMLAALKQLESPQLPELSPEIQATKSKLSPKTCLIGLVDLPGFLSRFGRLILQSGMIPFPLDPESISIPETTSYLGVSLATKSSGGRLKLHVPAEQAKRMYLLVNEVRAAFWEMQQQQF